jgi:hypothetical protein
MVSSLSALLTYLTYIFFYLYRKRSTSNPDIKQQSISDANRQSISDVTNQTVSEVTKQSISDVTDPDDENQLISDVTNLTTSRYDVIHKSSPDVTTQSVPDVNQNLKGGCGLDESNVPDSIVYSSSKDNITYEEALEMLMKPDLKKVSTKPPVRPEADEMYIISDEGNASRAHDWSCDGYSWSNRNGHSKEINGMLVWRQTLS